MKNSLPQGWIYSELSAITDIVSKINPKEKPNNRFKYLDIASIDNSIYKITSPKEYIGKDAPSRARQLVKSGDILFSTVRTYLKNIAFVEDKYDGQIASTGFCVIRPILMNSKFIFYFMFLKSFLDSLTEIQRGTSYPAVRNSDVFAQSIPIPPLHEQHRIVAKIEELFTKLDAGVDALKQVQAQLKRYRQSVLKAAVEGSLTAEWREQHKNELEPAKKILERIHNGRRAKLGKKYKEPLPVGASDLPKLPEKWEWAKVEQIGNVITGSTPSKSKPEFYGGEFPFYKPTDLNAGYFVKESADSLTLEGISAARLLPENTTLVTCIGATIGKTGFIKKPGASNQQINSIIPESQIYSKYIYFVCISPFFQNQILSKASSTTLPILNKSKFEKLVLMLPPYMEQEVMVRELEQLFSIIDEAGSIIKCELRRAQSLRQSILRRAFEGKLVPQDPNDEPASILLDRIKDEKIRLKKSNQLEMF